MQEGIRSFARLVARFLRAQSPQEREKRVEHAWALLLVAAVAIVKYVTGLTLHDAPFTLFLLVIAASAAWGGFAPALAATLASLLVVGLRGGPPGAAARLLFLAEGLSVAFIVSAFRSRVQAGESRLATAEATITDLRRQDRHERLLDIERHREWDEYRQAAANAQAALQQAADDTREQLASLESLTDPSLNPFGGDAMVTELLERLRASVRADGAALLQPARSGMGVVAARGLQPSPAPIADEGLRLSPGRVAVVHNDPARVEQLSALRWSADVASLLVVPVVYNGQVWSAIEVVSERPRQVSDWDVALVRIVADRLAAVVVRDRNLAAKAS